LIIFIELIKIIFHVYIINQAPVAVGLTARSSEDMYMSAGFGKCVDVVHVVGDYLYNIDKPLLRPKLGPPIIPRNESNAKSFEGCTSNMKQHINNDIHKISEDIDSVNVNSNKDDKHNVKTIVNNFESNHIIKHLVNDVKKELLDPLQKMDKLLEYCFLKACKTSLKRGDLPLITSTFFKNHIIHVCPTGCTVDVKKSSYKKLSVFLACMKEKGLIETSILKGVESLLSVKVCIIVLVIYE
jgi:translation initiation factor 2D